MSGICGVFNLDGAPADFSLIDRMTAEMRFRGPDGTSIWIDTSVALAHAMLRTTWESEAECQPTSLDGEVWITADARIDARSGLVAALRAHGRDADSLLPDSHLILHAYSAWGPACVERLLGDFAFAIWDGPQSTLFCARDHFGIKPFFYAHIGQCLVFGNTLNCLLAHPGLDRKVDDRAVVSFLAHSFVADPSITFYSGCKRLAPAHTLIASERGTRAQRYWSLPVPSEIHFRDSREYVEGFRAHLSVAVRDRLRCPRQSILLSGGLDSPAIAATARNLQRAGESSTELRAFTWVWDELIPHQERLFAGMVTRQLGFQHDFFVADAYKPFDRFEELSRKVPEPLDDPLYAFTVDRHAAVSRTAPVALYGEGGDEVLRPDPLFFLLRALWRRRELARLLAHLAARVQDKGFGGTLHALVSRATGLFRRSDGQPTNAAWLRPEWAAAVPPYPVAPAGSFGLHGAACAILTSPLLPAALEATDSGQTLAPLDVWYPFLDLRLVNYSLALPQFPWCKDKRILRHLWKGELPEAVLGRPKTPLRTDPAVAWARKANFPLTGLQEPALSTWIDPGRLSAACKSSYTEVEWGGILACMLGCWLRGHERWVERSGGAAE